MMDRSDPSAIRNRRKKPAPDTAIREGSAGQMSAWLTAPPWRYGPRIHGVHAHTHMAALRIQGGHYVLAEHVDVRALVKLYANAAHPTPTPTPTQPNPPPSLPGYQSLPPPPRYPPHTLLP